MIDTHGRKHKLFNNTLVYRVKCRLNSLFSILYSRLGLARLNSKSSILYSVYGFTISEMLVVIGVTVSLTSIVFVFGNPARQQIALSVEQARLSQIILRAKSLAVATFNQPPVPCGYGVAIDNMNNTYSIFSYENYDVATTKRKCSNNDIGNSLNTTNAINCGPAVFPYDPADHPETCYTELDTYTLPRGITFESGGSAMEYVLFRPPDPITMLFPDPSASSFKTVIIKTPSGSRMIKINSAGQLSFE